MAGKKPTKVTPIAAAAAETAGVDHKARAHARLSASGAYRWMACTASPGLEDQFPETTSSYAEAGTWMHEWSETRIRHWLGLTTTAEITAAQLELDKSEHATIEQKDAAVHYLNFVIERVTALREAHGRDNVVVLVEQRLDFSRWVPDGFGTGDLVIIFPGGIEVIDLKGGAGVKVYARENPQFRLYALGAYNTYNMLYDFETVSMTVAQPKLQHFETFTESVEDLLAWADGTLAPLAQIAHSGEGATFASGDHCQFCKAKSKCRARAEENLELAGTEFLQPELLDDAELSSIYLRLPALKAWSSDISEHVEGRAFKGDRFPDLKVVEGRSNRKITDIPAAKAALYRAGFPEDTITEPLPTERTLLGLTELEKRIGKTRFSEILQGLVEKPKGKPALVHASDPRTEMELTRESAEEDFA